jgi:hypothetical protein
MKRISILATLTALALAVSSGSALAAGGQVLCINGTSPITGPNSAGQCTKSGQTRVTVATESEVSSLQGQVATLQGQVSTLQGQVSTLQGQASDLQNDNTTLSSDVSALQNTLSKVSYNPQGLNGQPTLTISGANVQVVNGTGQTASGNGLGNLILGYDDGAGTQTGSHNLVLGTAQTFTSYGGLLGGRGNTTSGPDSTAFGIGNIASADGSAVTGGKGNVASNQYAAVSGGFGNKANYLSASVSGGEFNVASDYGASVTGGIFNQATGTDASVSGGESNTASGDHSAILGGNGNTVSWIDGTSP